MEQQMAVLIVTLTQMMNEVNCWAMLSKNT